MKKKIAVVGARGYSGLELCQIMLKHPRAELGACFTREPEWKLINDLNNDLALGIKHLSTDDIKNHAKEFDTIFLATPPSASIDLANVLKDEDVKIIDLSGGFRLNPQEYKTWYGSEHKAVDILNNAVYGLSPLANIDEIKKAKFISNPGCYATSVLMALIPLLKSGLAQADSIVIDSKSGTSGAGRKANEGMLLSEVYGNILPYRIGKHQHLPEICKYAEKFSGTKISPFFNTQVLPVSRGISSAIFAKTVTNMSDKDVVEALFNMFSTTYKDYPLIKFSKINEGDEAADKKILSISKVANTPLTYVGFTCVNSKIYMFSAIDNLLKGAASQAVENWNIANGYDVETGLI